MIKVVIVDDELDSSEFLQIRLEKYKNDLEIVGVADNIKDAKKLILEHKPKVVFLDIQMPGGSGFDLLKEFSNPEFEVVFVTAYNEYAIKAIKLSALDYLLKPINREELELCVNKLKKKINTNKNSDFTSKINILHENFAVSDNNHMKLVVHIINGYEVAALEDIICIKAESNYSRLFLKNNKELLATKTLKQFEAVLFDKLFFRIHNSSLININHIKSFTKGKNCTVVMSNGFELNVSRFRRGDFLNLFFG